jgi:hypothetical protein
MLLDEMVSAANTSCDAHCSRHASSGLDSRELGDGCWLLNVDSMERRSAAVSMAGISYENATWQDAQVLPI